MSKREKVAVGMSGGLDSSVAAACLLDAGYEVQGVTLCLCDDAERRMTGISIDRAHAVAEMLGIPHRYIDARLLFEDRIIRPFVRDYIQGLTPSPCIHCNEFIKFGFLLERARELGCDRIATGHYVRSELRFDGWHLLRGLDRQKDQSYFLHRLTQAQLDASLFPLGDVSRKGVEAYARDKGLPVSAGRSSQDLCFVQDEGYIPLIRKYYTELPGKGHIRDGDGRVLGEHEGHYRYTVGQRKGLGIAVGEPMYVLEICPETNEVFVGTREQGQQRLCRIRDIQWIQPERHKQDEYRLSVRIRYRHQAAPARLRVQGTNRGEIEFDEPQFAVTPGQAAVFYNDEEVLGGGWIECPHTHFAVDH